MLYLSLIYVFLPLDYLFVGRLRSITDLLLFLLAAVGSGAVLPGYF